MRALPDGVLDHLREVADAPDLSGSRYRMIRSLARGGMGSLYVVEDTELGREVALKVVSLPDAPAEIEDRLRREARILAQLEHPNIVPVHDVGRLADGRVFYVMKLVRGERLDVWARAGRSRAEVLRLFQKICEAVAFANAHGIVHRDLKPDNVMVGEWGEALVMDWGIAKVRGGSPSEPAPALAPAPVPDAALADTLVAPLRAVPATAPADAAATVADTRPGAILGTPAYMAPEQASGDNDRVDARTDVHALGGLLYFLLTGRPPYPGRSAQEILLAVRTAPPPSAHAVDRAVPRALDAIVAKALAKEPRERYATGQEMGAEIDRFLDGLSPRAHRETAWEKVTRFGANNRVVLLLLGAYLLARGVVLIFAGR